MKYFVATAAALSAIPGILSMTINTPTSVVQCQPQLISWADGMAPFYLSVIPGGQPGATPLKTFDTQSGSSTTWIVDLPAGTIITLALKDTTGATAYSDVVTIQKGSSTDCQSSTGSGSSSSSSSSSSGGSAQSGSDSSSSSASSVLGHYGTTTGGTGSGTSIRGTTSVPLATQSRAVAGTTTSSARTSTTSTSGAKFISAATGVGFVGFVGLAAVLFL